MEAAEFLGVQNFNASDGWLTNFKRRHAMASRRLRGEAAGINIDALTAWQNNVLKNKLANFDADDVFNIDETALFWKLWIKT